MRADLHRAHTARTGTALAGIHEPAAFRLVLADMMQEERSSCRALARRLGRDKTTIWRWRRRIIEAFAAGADQEPGTIGTGPGTDGAGPLERFRESRKASREWVNHARDPACHPAPNRPRWVDVDSGRLPAPAPMTRFRVAVQLHADGGGVGRVVEVGGKVRDGRPAGGPVGPSGSPHPAATIPCRVAGQESLAGKVAAVTWAGAVPPPWPPAFRRVAAAFAPCIAPVDGQPRGLERQIGSGALSNTACSAIAPQGRIDPPIEAPVAESGMAVAGAACSAMAHAGRSDTPDEGPFAASGTLSELFKAFLGPFRGPSTRYLEGYVAWFGLAATGTAKSRLATAWRRLLARPPTEFADIIDSGTPLVRARAAGRVAGGRMAPAAGTV